MKRILFYIFIWWFFYNPQVSLIRFADCYLETDSFCLTAFDFNDDRIVNLYDFAILTQEDYD